MSVWQSLVVIRNINYKTKDINKDDLIRVDKEYILQDYKKKEADIVYRMKFKNTGTLEVKDIIFYILMELQSSVDKMMPYRLLMYMVQIWKQELSNVKYNEVQHKDYKLPTIVPIVLYNGDANWDAVMQFKDLQEKSEKFGAYLVDFSYILVATNSYDVNDLIKIANAISCIIMMDQTKVAKDKDEMMKRLHHIVGMKDILPPEKMNIILEWLKEVFLKRLPEDETKKTIENLKEVEAMTYAIEKLVDDIEEKAEMKRAVESAKRAIGKGLLDDDIADITGLDIGKIQEIREKLNKEIIHQ